MYFWQKENTKGPIYIVIMVLLLSIVISATSYLKSEDMFLLIATQILQRIYSSTGESKITQEPTDKSSLPETNTEYKLYTVNSGDSLWKIANKHQTTVRVLKSLNGLETEELYKGQTLKIPFFDEDLLARLVHSEAEGESFEGQIAVAAVVLNRLRDPRFPDSLEEVIYEKNAFEVVANGRIQLPAGSSATKAVKAALSGVDPSKGSVFFYNPDKIKGFNWVQSRKVVCRIGNHVFAR